MLGDSGGNSGGGPCSVGNPWAREETLALITIRSEMAAAFRDVSIKGKASLWEEVSRKLAELGYEGRSASKCKDKLESLHRSYNHAKRRHDGTSYRFSQALDALHAATARARPQRPMSAMPPPRFPVMPAPVSWAAPAAAVEVKLLQPPPASLLQGVSFPSMSESESDDDDGSEDGETAAAGIGKRKRGGGVSEKKMMAFLERVMKQVVQRQEEMHQRFLAAMEKREAERAAREEAWRRQEMARLKREQEQRAHERAAAATRDAYIIAFLQRVVGQGQAVPPVAVPTPTPMHVQSLRTPPPAKDPRQNLPPLRETTPQSVTMPIPAPPLQLQPPQAQEHKETTTQEEDQYSPWFRSPWN
ncbi:hypothetical protein ZWY2020_014246 [Hordeum vulgare]|nr:hypothetical protein ZWY2020_014246 [Hordeum vulgare]